MISNEVRDLNLNLDGDPSSAYGGLGITKFYSIKFGEVPKRPTGPDCKSGGSAFTGSNPVLTTTVMINHHL